MYGLRDTDSQESHKFSMQISEDVERMGRGNLTHDSHYIEFHENLTKF
jgi:hypothetical protein